MINSDEWNQLELEEQEQHEKINNKRTKDIPEVCKNCGGNGEVASFEVCIECGGTGVQAPYE